MLFLIIWFSNVQGITTTHSTRVHKEIHMSYNIFESILPAHTHKTIHELAAGVAPQGRDHSFFFSNFALSAPLYGATWYAYCWRTEKTTISRIIKIFWIASWMCSTSSQKW